MKEKIEELRQYLRQMQPADGESVLKMLYEYHSEHQPYDNEQIKADFKDLYRQMNGMPLQEMDKIIYPVCKLCRDHELAGFMEGVKMGVRLAEEVESA